MNTSTLKGKYFPALKALANLNPLQETAGIGTGNCDYMGTVWNDDIKLYVWNPFVKVDPNATLNPESITIKDMDNAPIADAVISAKLTAEGIQFSLDITKLTVGVGDKLTMTFQPDASWPKLDNTFEPRPGACSFNMPANWTTG